MQILKDLENKKESIALLLSVLLFSICYIVLKSSFGILISDDAYITLSHVKTWVTQGRPVMSLHNPVNATSTPLFTMMLSLFTLIAGHGHIISIAYFSATLFEILSLFLIFHLARKLEMALPFALLATFAVGLSRGFYASSAFGMETTLSIFLVLAALYMALFRSEKIISLCVALFCVTLVRPEGALAAGIVILVRLISGEKRRVLFVYCIITLVALAAFFLFYYISYGNILPHSVVAKQAQVDFGLSDAFSSWMAHAFYKGPVFGGRRIILGINLLACVIGLAGLSINKKKKKSVYLILWPLLYILFFVVTRSSDPLMPWYFFPVVPFFILLLCNGIAVVINRFSIKPVIIWIFVYLFVLYCFSAMFWQKAPDNYIRAERVREQRYQQALKSIELVADKSDIIMIDEVGTIGFFSDYKILDSHGLLSPEVLPVWDKCRDYHILNKMLVMQFHPDWVFYTRSIKYLEHRYSEGENAVFGQYTLYKSLSAEPSPFLLELWQRKKD